MFRDAVNEIRLHPGRIIATLVAIAIAVGFFAAIAIAVGTETRGLALGDKPQVRVADVISDSFYSELTPETLDDLAQIPGVEAVWFDRSAVSLITKDAHAEYIRLVQVPDDAFVWFDVLQGRAPKPGTPEVALPSDLMSSWKLSLGDVVTDASGEPLTVVGEINDTKTVFGSVAVGGAVNGWEGRFLLRTSGDPAAVAAEVTAITGEDAWSYQEFIQHAAQDQTGGIDVLKFLLYGFAGISLVVGIIIISNTFTILITQRRRQIALLRAVGASSAQVRGRLIVEALLIGVLGSALGLILGFLVALGISYITGSIRFGLDFQINELVWSFAVGVLVTLIAMLAPSLAATKVPPIEALQAVPSVAQEKRIGVARLVVCSILGGLGFLLAIGGWVGLGNPFVMVILGCMLMVLGLLFGAPLYVAPLLRLLGKSLSFLGPTVRLAAENAARTPRRAAATIVALMLAVGLIVTLQVVISTSRSTGVGYIQQTYPIGAIATDREGDEFTDAQLEQLEELSIVERAVAVPGKLVEGTTGSATFVVDAGQAKSLLETNSDSFEVAPGEVIISMPDGMQPLVVDGKPLKAKLVDWLPSETVMVSSQDFQKIDGDVKPIQAWMMTRSDVNLSDIGDVVQLTQQVDLIGGAFPQILLLQSVLTIFMIILSTLLGVAVLIALVGVGNTLGLSILERQRESALLRALGMQRSEVRTLVLTEAMLMGVLAVAVGLLGGSFFGWIGVSTTINALNAVARDNNLDVPEITTRFSIDPLWTGGLIALCLVAAALASVLPGRKASKATPTEALAMT